MRDLQSSTVPPPGAILSGLAVRDDGSVLAATNPDHVVTPASNTKLLTTAIALDVLGPDFQFETVARADGELERPLSETAGDRQNQPELDGDLRLVGVGAPDFDSNDVETLAQRVRDQISHIRGDLLLDTTLFRGPRYGPGRTREDAKRAYGAPTTALVFDGNTVTVSVHADADDDCSIGVEPDSEVLDPTVDVCTGEETAVEADVTFEAGLDGDGLRVSGTLPTETTVEGVAPVHRPVRHLGHRLYRALADEGVTIDGQPTVVASRRGLVGPSADGAESKLDRATPIVTVESEPLSTLVRTMNRHSDNVYADTLARAIAGRSGGSASWEHWRTLVSTRLAALGVEPGRVRDGSGLSRYNGLSARAVVETLRWASARDWSAAFFDSLPRPGEGTLADRLRGIPVVAKTGTLTGVHALSGLVRRESERIYFSLLVGNVTVGADEVRDGLDGIVREIASA